MPRALDLEVTGPVKGLHYEVQPTFIPPEASPKLENVRLHRGVVEPAPGYANFGSLNTVLGTPQLIKQYVENDGDIHLLCFTTKYIYEYNTTLANWGNVVSRQKVLSECESAWTDSANVTSSQETTIRVNGTNALKIAIGAAFTTGLAAYEDFTAVDTTTCSHIHFWIRSNVATDAGDLQILVDDTSGCVSALETYDVPALEADTWTQVEVAIGTGSNAAVISVGLNVAVDNGAQNVYLDRIIMADRFTGDEDSRWSVDTYLDKFYATNGVDAIQVKDHSSAFDDWAEAVSAQYKCRRLRAFRNHLVMGYMIEAGVEYPQRFRWTASGAVTFGGTAGSTETEGVDAILQLLPIGTRLAIYKENSIVNVTHIGGSTVYRFDRAVTNNGLLAPDLVIPVGELHLFVASDDVYFYGGGADPVPVGKSIRDELFRVISDTYIERSFSYYSPENQEVYFFIPSDGNDAANYVWVYDVVDTSWTLLKRDTGFTAVGAYSTASALTFGDAVGSFGVQTTTFGDRSLSSTAPLILFGDENLLIGEISPSTVDDLGVAISNSFDTPDFSASRLPIPGDQPVRYTDNTKRWMRFAFEAKGSEVEIWYSRDEGASYTHVKTVTLTQGWARYYVSIDIPADRLRFRFLNDTVSSSFYLRWYSVSVIGHSEV